MIYRSPFPDVEIAPVSLATLVLDSARARGDKVALLDGPSGQETTFVELVRRVERTAAGLQERGFRKGDVALLCTPNCSEFAIAFLAVALAGGATTPMSPSFTEGEMAAQIADSGAVLAFVAPELAVQVERAGKGRLRALFCFGETDLAPTVRSLESAGPVPVVEIDPSEDVVVLPYSSGTTGTPKGVMLTHRNLVAIQAQMGPVEATTSADVVIAVLPFFHIYGLSVILLLALCRGATLVVFPRFEMESFLAAVERFRVTRLPLVPPLLLRLARDARVADFDLSSVRTVISGAAPLAPEIAAEVAARLGCLVKQGYGMTELSPGGHMHPEDRGAAPPGSVGLAHPNTETRLVDPATGLDVDEGEPGEIWYRGPQVMKGYLGKPTETAAAISPEGWLRTGDIGRIDSEGRLYVVDRLKELIKYNGYQVAPAELEALLLTHEGIADVAVIPLANTESGEIPKAFVIPRAGAHLTEDGVMQFVAERVAHYKKVRAVEFVDDIPRSPTGKILRRVLVERERAVRGQGG